MRLDRRFSDRTDDELEGLIIRYMEEIDWCRERFQLYSGFIKDDIRLLQIVLDEKKLRQAARSAGGGS